MYGHSIRLVVLTHCYHHYYYIAITTQHSTGLFHKGEQAVDEAAASAELSAELGKEKDKGITGICDDEARGESHSTISTSSS
jgi:hypothetical protein